MIHFALLFIMLMLLCKLVRHSSTSTPTEHEKKWSQRRSSTNTTTILLLLETSQPPKLVRNPWHMYTLSGTYPYVIKCIQQREPVNLVFPPTPNLLCTYRVMCVNRRQSWFANRRLNNWMPTKLPKRETRISSHSTHE